QLALTIESLKERIKELKTDLQISNDANMKLIKDNRNILAVNQNLSEQLQTLTDEELFNRKKNDKKEEKFKYFILREYVKLSDVDSLLYFQQCFIPTYERIAILYEMIGIHLNALPFSVAWFTTRN
ncbi:4115_t:CDS:2, partial [Racocetra fulgida]